MNKWDEWKTIRFPSEIPPEGKPAVLTCPKHGYYNGFVTFITVLGREIDSQCPACADEEAEAYRQQLAKKRAAIAMANPAIACIPKLFRRKNYRDYEVTCPEADAVKRQIGAYITEFDTILEEGSCLLLTGNSGTGKSHLACAVLNNVAMRGKSVMYIRNVDFITRIKEAWTPTTGKTEASVIREMCEHQLIVFDEVGKTPLDGKEKAMLFNFVDHRHENMQPTIYISNYSLDKLSKLYGPEIVRRMRGNGGKNLIFSWKAYDND